MENKASELKTDPPKQMYNIWENRTNRFWHIRLKKNADRKYSQLGWQENTWHMKMLMNTKQTLQYAVLIWAHATYSPQSCQRILVCFVIVAFFFLKLRVVLCGCVTGCYGNSYCCPWKFPHVQHKLHNICYCYMLSVLCPKYSQINCCF